ncbi:putative nucleotidyltransferase component of viral defense system [Enterococcus sp. PF1-24]|uniref:nucleotidyl transferase AbiEii/AbiGii toxin family protein n=1 Tax=unclassified Enterococcus TaxID=2608891 RepID=UPI002476AF38|nr:MULTISPECIES: nucleotidyl transferase AbiEii/AbiGii toxin family protein [unclassified Enterococcus]MDH6364529.1 putative nucleotidyltransferase component of viral defense system [Enterococcus sp. PFB1-1]MDH6401594.1 putative nucleotidyltransferase component of viral defense system [Enterococcus sp. PF1-24]
MLSEQKMKNVVNQRSKEYDISVNNMYSMYALEQLVTKISQSEYKDNFVLKGGYLLTSIYGLDNRTTKDFDSTIRRVPLDENQVRDFAKFIEEGEPAFEVKRIKTIRERFDYDGFNIKLDYINGKVRVPFDIDLTTGEDTLPIKENVKIPLLFSDGEIQMPAYPVEQVLSDKLYTTLAYGAEDDKNSRSKDLYDIHFLTKMNKDVDYQQIVKTIEKTKIQRNIVIPINQYDSILESLKNSDFQKDNWNKYRESKAFARDIEFSEVMNSVKLFSSNVERAFGSLSISEQREIGKSQENQFREQRGSITRKIENQNQHDLW